MSPIEVNKNFPEFGIGKSSVAASHSTDYCGRIMQYDKVYVSELL